MKLNPQQMAAVHYVEGPLLVLAGAGSGKTRVITHKIAYLIEHCGYKPHHIMAVTFTNKAAEEMRTRVSQTLPADKRRGMQIATFHTLGLSILKRHTQLCHLKSGFTIFDSEDCLQILKGFLPAGKASDRDYLFRLQQQISFWKNDLLRANHPDLLKVTDAFVQEAVLLYDRYQQTLKAYNAVDFDDLICLPVLLLQQDETVKTYWQNKIHYLLVDEYQDSNTSQYELVKLLTGLRAQFTVVGDDDQSIYAWRGAKPENLALLQQDFPALNIIKLEQNYRSSGRILGAANHLIAHNPHLFEKALWSELGPGEPPRVIYCKDEEHEAEQVIADLISHKLRYGRQYGEYAILYRGNHQSRLFEKILRHHSIPYQLSGGQSWFGRKEVKDMFAYLKLLINEKDDAAFLRAINVPKRGVGETSLQALGHYAQRVGMPLYACADHLALGGAVAEKPRHILSHFKQWLQAIRDSLTMVQESAQIAGILRTMVQDSGYEVYLYDISDTPAKAQKQMDNVWELIAWIERLLSKEPGHTLTDVINKLILIDILDKADDQGADKVQLMTLHAAKGLEFPFVYLVGLEEGLLPHRISIEEEQITEERRLLYVGITRAQKELCLTLARKRRSGNEKQETQPSRFLAELPQEGFEWFGFNKEPNEAQSRQLARSHLAGLKQLLT